jgi:cell division protein FtsL
MLNLRQLETKKISAEEVRADYLLFESSSDEYRYQMAEDHEFYLGSQLTKSQKNYLLSVGQPPEANNKIRPAVEQVLANIAASAPEWDVHSVGKTDNDAAFVFDQLLDKIWYDSDADVHFRQACKDFIVKGLAYMYIYPDWQGDGGLGTIKVKRMPPESIFVDPNSSMPDFSDASSIIYSDLHTKEHLKVLFPQYAKQIDDAEENHQRNEQESGKYSRDNIETRGSNDLDHQSRVRKYCYFKKVNIPHALILDTNTGKNQLYNQEEYKELIKDDKYEDFLQEGIITEQLAYQTRIREVFVVGDIVLYDEILPISEYPIAVACNEHAGNPFPSGDVRHAKTPQRMLNRTEALIISHTNATTNFKLLYEDGAIDASEIQKWHIPNAIIRANPGALATGKIKEFAPPAVSSQLYTEKSRYEVDIETVFGAYKFLQGNAQGAPGTVGEAQIMDESSSRKQNWKILPIYDMLTKTAKVVTQWMPSVYDQQRTLRIVSPVGDESELTLNIPVIDDKTNAVKKLYDMTTSQFDVRVVVGSTRSKSPMAELQKDLTLLNAGIYDKTQVIMNMKGDIDKASLMQRMGEIANLQAQLQQAQEELKKMQGDLQTREREVFHANMRAEISEATKPVSEAVSNIKSNAKLEQARQRDKTRMVGEELSVVKQAINSESKAPQA